MISQNVDDFYIQVDVLSDNSLEWWVEDRQTNTTNIHIDRHCSGSTGIAIVSNINIELEIGKNILKIRYAKLFLHNLK